ncbi:MAG: exopolysaccharide Pel transporter PelG [Deltaproteobacteria bacterium]|nr:exopolysaccharide Pel transporter PelG [Deltaproteobacteria bacterium]
MPGTIFLLERRTKKPLLTLSAVREAGDSFEAIGPWFLTVFSLVVMGLGVSIITGKPPLLFYLMITYGTALSLILSSPLHSMFARYLADEIFLGHLQEVASGMLALTVLVAGLSLGLSSLMIFYFSTISAALKVGFVALTTILSLLWCISSVFSALQKERLMFKLFIGGVSFGLCLFLLLKPRGTERLLLVFSIGMLVPTAGGYGYLVKLYMREKLFLNWAFLRKKGAVRLGFSLFSFTLGFWADKMVFWFFPGTGDAYDPFFHYSAEYDFPFFIAITLMMIGSLLVYKGMKRRITGPYEAFVYKLYNNFPFRELALEKFRLVQGIGQVSSSILLFYGGLSLLVLFFLYFRSIPFPWKNPFVFHYLLLGSIFFSLYFFYFLVLQYLDDFKGLVLLNTLFLFTNSGFTFISIKLGWKFFGTGFMAASVISALTAFFLVNGRVGGLEYEVFRKAVEEQRKEKGKGSNG